MDKYFNRANGSTTFGPKALCIAAGARHIAALRDSSAIGSLGSANLIEIGVDEPLSQAALGAADILVLEVDPAEAASIRRIRAVRSAAPDLKIIAAIAEADVALVKALVRQGISDVAELPFAPEELAAQVLDLCSLELSAQDEVPLAPMITALRSVGGAGCTSLLTHLAAELAQTVQDDRGVCLVDLDLQGGEVASYCGSAAHVTIATLLDADDRLDEALIDGTVIETRHGFSIIAAPEAIMPMDHVNPDHIEFILTALRRRFAYVLVDLPADISNWSLGVAAAATQSLIVAEGSIASLRQARRRIDLLESIGIERSTIKVAANRCERRLFRTVGTDDMALALQTDVIATLNDEGTAIRSAQDQGMLLSEAVGRNSYVKAIASLARSLHSGSD